jgi:DNA helicase-2/ATP-dependent DNA helicase PcrA
MKKAKSSNRTKSTREQRRVSKCEDPVISLRGYHGTGKTKTAVEYTIHRLQTDKNSRILVVTLTKRAAANFAERLHCHPDWRPEFNHRVRVGTFHSFAQSYIRKFASLIGVSPSFLLDNDINNKILNKLLKDRKFKFSENPAKYLNDLNRRHVRSTKGLKSTVRQNIKKRKDQKGAIRILKRMRSQKKEMNVLDHDDTLYYFRRLLKKESRLVDDVFRDFSHMVVDEFQDTTDIQWQTMKILIGEGMRFLGAGDPYQTLFRYTGASLNRFNELESLEGCRKFELTENHRTTKQIVALANAVLGQHSPTNAHTVWSKIDGAKPQVLLNTNMGFLCKALLEKIRQHIENDALSLNDVLVTFRNDSITNYLRKMLNKLKLPYVFHSKTARDTPEVVAVVTAILEISMNNGNKARWKMVLPYLSGIGVQKTEKILKILANHKYRYQGLRTPSKEMPMQDLGKLYKLFLKANLLKGKPLKSTKIILRFLKGLKRRIPGLETQSKKLIIMAERSTDSADFIENLKQQSFGQYYIPKRHQTTDNFLTLGNVHQIKGQEFKVVFILGSYDTFFENHNSFENEDSITDELFIMHTAITRSREYLYMLFPTTYFDWVRKNRPNNPSSFIKRSPNKLYDAFSIVSV